LVETTLTGDYNLHKYREDWQYRPEFKGIAHNCTDSSTVATVIEVN